MENCTSITHLQLKRNTSVGQGWDSGGTAVGLKWVASRTQRGGKGDLKGSKVNYKFATFHLYLHKKLRDLLQLNDKVKNS